MWNFLDLGAKLYRFGRATVNVRMPSALRRTPITAIATSNRLDGAMPPTAGGVGGSAGVAGSLIKTISTWVGLPPVMTLYLVSLVNAGSPLSMILA